MLTRLLVDSTGIDKDGMSKNVENQDGGKIKMAADSFFNIFPFYARAAAPEMISISSLVMTACRVLLKVRVSLSIISPAFLLALSMEVMREDCSEQAPSFMA